MSVRRSDPFRDLQALQDRMHQLFEEVTRSGPRQPDGQGRALSWSPPVDIYETADEIVVKAELPGIAREDLELSLEEDVLTLRGNRDFERPGRDESYHQMERSFGPFQRSFAIPARVNESEIRAEYRNGVLTIVLPRANKVKPRQVQIKG